MAVADPNPIAGFCFEDFLQALTAAIGLKRRAVKKARLWPFPARASLSTTLALRQVHIF